jgi:hypothetical protein
LEAEATSIRISGKEVEEVGFEKIRKQLAELHELRIVLLDGLCIRRPVDEATKRAWREYGGGTEYVPPSDIFEVCPKITELDLSRNLFEEWADIVSICEQLKNLKSLRVDGNRFKNATITAEEREYFQLVFSKIKHLHLESTLLSWREIVDICSLFRNVQSLILSHNSFETLDPTVSLKILTSTITSIDLESNQFTALSDLAPLRTLPNLQTLILKSNPIASTASANESSPTFSSNLTTLDLSHAQIQAWSLIDTLPLTFPGLTSLRISHNPLYTSLTSPDHRILSTDDGYMLTIARLPRLKSLNYSTITAKDRLNAESYYLSLIASELSFAAESEEAAIKARHRRWSDLCEEYGEPEIKRSSNRLNPNSLAARLLTLHFHHATAPKTTSTFIASVPKSLSAYAVHGIAGKNFGLPALRIKLMHETGEWDVINKSSGGADEGPWDSSDESDDGGGGAETEWGERRVRREVLIVPGTRNIGSWIDGNEGVIRVELQEAR